MTTTKYTLFWFRRDLRLHDNAGLFHALSENPRVLPIFIFDLNILEKLKDREDRRVEFLHKTLAEIKSALESQGSDLLVYHGRPLEVFPKILAEIPFTKIYTNHDYEPYPRKRDEEVRKWCEQNKIEFQTFKDQVIFEKSEILTDAEKPYTVFTAYKNKWLKTLAAKKIKSFEIDSLKMNFAKIEAKKSLSLKDLGFQQTECDFPEKTVSPLLLKNYAKNRDFPYFDQGTSHLGLHLRFGTVSIREMVKLAEKNSDVWLSELIWREFFMQILWHYPGVVTKSFRSKFEEVDWREDKKEFQKWCEGKTGYPLVDAGMRELNQTGYMHNRVRMVVASFLTKHLVMHWFKGERYFAEKLLDYDLAANNGNWQWAAGTGCDAAPYFRIFNPESQQKKFDPKMDYIRKWVPEYGTLAYPEPMVDHKTARIRCMSAFDKAFKKGSL